MHEVAESRDFGRWRTDNDIIRIEETDRVILCQSHVVVGEVLPRCLVLRTKKAGQP